MSKKSKKYYMNKCKKLWRKACIERDNHTCCYCGKEFKKMDVHHIVNKSQSKRLRYDVENGICLCSGCHTLSAHSAHKNPAVFNEWLKKYVGDIRYDYLMRQNAITEPLPFDFWEGELERLKEME